MFALNASQWWFTGNHQHKKQQIDKKPEKSYLSSNSEGEAVNKEDITGDLKVSNLKKENQKQKDS